MDSQTAKKLEYILSGYQVSSEDLNSLMDLMDSYKSETSASLPCVVESFKKDKPLTICQCGRDGECWHPKCPVKDKAITIIQTLMNATGAEFEDEELAIEILEKELKNIGDLAVVRLSLPSVLEARQEADDNYSDGERWTAFVKGATWVMIEANKRKGSEA